MNLIFYTTELSAANAHLMPWRTLLEVARVWKEAGHRVLVFSGGCRISEEVIGDIRVEHVLRPKSSHALDAFALLMKAFVKGENGRLYFPIAPGSDYSLMAQRVESLGIEVVWYHPGAWYGKDQVLKALSVMPFRAVLPYIIQAFYPKRGWLKKLGSRPLITMTSFTAKRIQRYGYKGRVISIYPGKNMNGASRKDAKEQSIEDVTSILASSSLGGKPYFLFFGPPNPIRGVFHILEAFKRVLLTHPDCRLVCLFRGDANVDRKVVKHRIEKLGFGDKVVALWESVSAAELDVFLRNCYAVLKPFVLVPSEIPLAVIETAEYGKPVIGFEGDGTGEFIERFGLVASHGSVNSLAAKMMLLLDDKARYEACCQAALKLYSEHPSWADVAAAWLKAGKQ